MAAFMCRHCRQQARTLTLPFRPFTTSTRRPANDPASNLADILSPTKAPRPASNPPASATPSTPIDGSNPFLHPSADTLPDDTNPTRRATPSTSSASPTTPPTHQRPQTQTQAQAQPQTQAGQQQAPGQNPNLIPSLRNFLSSRRSGGPSDSRSGLTPNQNSAASLKAARERTQAIENQQPRPWRDGDVYSPHDLSPVEQQKHRQARNPRRDSRVVNTRKSGGRDVLDDLGISPVKEYKNFKMMSDFVTEMGRIRHARETGFRGVNQRRMAKAVRRAHALGLLPTVHRHPELMREREDERSGR